MSGFLSLTKKQVKQLLQSGNSRILIEVADGAFMRCLSPDIVITVYLCDIDKLFLSSYFIISIFPLLSKHMLMKLSAALAKYLRLSNCNFQLQRSSGVKSKVSMEATDSSHKNYHYGSVEENNSFSDDDENSDINSKSIGDNVIELNTSTEIEVEMNIADAFVYYEHYFL